MEEQMQPTEAPKLATETLMKKGIPVTLTDADGEETTLVLTTFAFGKTVRAFAILTELAASMGISDLMGAASRDNPEGEEKPTMATNFITALLAGLPKLLKAGGPTIFRLLGLIVTGNKELKRLEEEDGVDVDAELLKRGRDLAFDYDNEEIFRLVTIAVQLAGVETVIENLVPLMAALMRRG